MRGNQKFYICEHCGNMVGLINDNGVPLVCCGKNMTELVPNTVDASKEKHVPVVTASGNTLSVQIGSAPHPMEKEHHISFVYVETKQGGQRKALDVGASPKCAFSFSDDTPVAVFAYCNLHGMWKAQV